MGNYRGPRPGATTGEVVEWLMAPVLKTGDPQGSVGSNPTLSVLKPPKPGRPAAQAGARRPRRERTTPERTIPPSDADQD